MERWTVIGVLRQPDMTRAIYAKGPPGLKIGDELASASEVERLKEALEKIAESQAGRHEGYIYDIAREALNVRDC